ncbi:MAG: hypothetical protein AAFN40_15305 [Cyanobacteria bacterium J06560_6]
MQRQNHLPPKIRHKKVRSVAVTIGLLLGLGSLTACVTPSTPLPKTDTAQSDRSSPAAETSSPASCELNKSSPESLSTSANEPVFEQFNFRPQEIAIAGGSVTLTSAHHIFSYCQANDTWSITSADAIEDEAAYDYDQEIADIADPPYDTIEVDGDIYEYRVRLQAEWLSEMLKPETTDPEAIADPEESSLPAATEDAVFFEIKQPDGTLVSQQLYTLSELQDAQLGASLGPPDITGVATANTDIWFATTAEQGEGNSGFASLIRYSPDTEQITVERPDAIQGDQITSLAVTGTAESTTPPLTLWLGTQRSGEGVPYYPASGLVAYQPETKQLSTHTITNSPLIGAIPYQVAVNDDSLWVGTGGGTCQVQWQTIAKADSWTCWKFTATAELPNEGVELFNSVLAEEPVATLKEKTVEVLWGSSTAKNTQERNNEPNSTNADSVRYEVVYEPGFETELSQGGYRITNEVAQRAAGGNDIFWPGNQWHWNGQRFKRSLDEVALNLVGGGPYGLVTSNRRDRGFGFDSNTIRGEFDLLALTDDTTKVRYYSGWIEGDNIDVYPTVLPAEQLAESAPNPLTKMAADLTTTQGP